MEDKTPEYSSSPEDNAETLPDKEAVASALSEIEKTERELQIEERVSRSAISKRLQENLSADSSEKEVLAVYGRIWQDAKELGVLETLDGGRYEREPQTIGENTINYWYRISPSGSRSSQPYFESRMFSSFIKNRLDQYRKQATEQPSESVANQESVERPQLQERLSEADSIVIKNDAGVHWFTDIYIREVGGKEVVRLHPAKEKRVFKDGEDRMETAVSPDPVEVDLSILESGFSGDEFFLPSAITGGEQSAPAIPAGEVYFLDESQTPSDVLPQSKISSVDPSAIASEPEAEPEAGAETAESADTTRKNVPDELPLNQFDVKDFVAAGGGTEELWEKVRERRIYLSRTGDCFAMVGSDNWAKFPSFKALKEYRETGSDLTDVATVTTEAVKQQVTEDATGYEADHGDYTVEEVEQVLQQRRRELERSTDNAAEEIQKVNNLLDKLKINPEVVMEYVNNIDNNKDTTGGSEESADRSDLAVGDMVQFTESGRKRRVESVGVYEPTGEIHLKVSGKQGLFRAEDLKRVPDNEGEATGEGASQPGAGLSPESVDGVTTAELIPASPEVTTRISKFLTRSQSVFEHILEEVERTHENDEKDWVQKLQKNDVSLQEAKGVVNGFVVSAQSYRKALPDKNYFARDDLQRLRGDLVWSYNAFCADTSFLAAADGISRDDFATAVADIHAVLENVNDATNS